MLRTLTIRILTACLLSLLTITMTAATRLNGRLITTQNGLPSNQVQTMLQDPMGYIWIGTNSGLCRYDGYSTVSFRDVGCGKGRTTGNVGTLCLDEQNQLLWMRTAVFNYACYDLRQGCFRDFSGACDPQKSFQRFVTEPGGIWMSEQGAGIRHVSYSDGRFDCQDFGRENGLKAEARIRQLIADEGRGAWVITDKGLYYIDGEGHVSEMIADERILAGGVNGGDAFFLTGRYEVKVFRDGGLIRETAVPPALAQADGVNGSFVWQDQWVVLTRSGVITMDCRNFTFQRPQELQMAYGILLDKTDGDYWVSDKDNVLHFFPKTGAHKTFRLLNDVGYDIARKRRFSVARATDGKYYIATYGGGLFAYDADASVTTHYSANDAQPLLVSNYLTNILCDRNGGVWVGQEDAGLLYIKEVEQPETGYLFPAPDRRGEMVNYISQLQPQADGSVMIGTRSRLTFCFSPATNSITKAGITDFDDTASNTVTDRLGRSWVATWEQGLTLIDRRPGASVRQQQFLTRSTNESRVNGLCMDSHERLWVATANGLYQVDTGKESISNDSFTNYNTHTGFPSNQLTCVMAAAGDTIWTGGVNTGIIRCVLGKDGTLQTDIVSDGQSPGNIQSIVCDSRGDVWAGTSEAVLRVLPRQTKAVAYRVGSSFLNSICSSNCALLLADGRLMFGTHDGLILITPSETAPQEYRLSAPVVTNIEVNGKQALQPLKRGGLDLAHNENSLTLFFSCLDYAHADEIVYQCFLEGADHEWRQPASRNRMEYNHLPPGRYMFHVRTAESSAETTLSVVIRQPWWNTWWAWMLYLLFAGAIAYSYYRHRRERFRLHQQMKMDQQLMEMRTNLFTSITHEFRTPLAIIKGGVDKLAEDSGRTARSDAYPGDASLNRAAIQTVRRGTMRLLRVVNQFIEFRKIQAGSMRIQVEQADIVSFVQDIVHDFRPMASQKDISLTFTPAVRRHVMPFDKQHVESIVYNLLSNAVKYTPERGTVLLRLRSENGELKMTCADSGPGISDEQQKVLFKPFLHGLVSQGGMGIGLHTAYETARVHKGSLSYERSAELGGSCFTLTLPADDSAYEPQDYREQTAFETAANEESTEGSNELLRELQPAAFNDITVAVIEDDPDMMLQISSEIGVYFQTRCFSNGQSALDFLLGTDTDGKQLPALLLCDVMLPDMNGYDIVRKIKESSTTASLPVIMLTALADEKHQIRAYQAGADDYMVKPCNFRLLIARSIQLIKWRQKQEVSLTSPQQEAPSTATPTPSAGGREGASIITSRADKVFTEKLDKFIVQHLSDENFTLDQLAQLMSMGRTKFFGKVKELTGMPPNKYILDIRMKRAADLLADGELTVAEVCYKVGIQDPSYFNKLFKTAYGVPPSKYKREA